MATAGATRPLTRAPRLTLLGGATAAMLIWTLPSAADCAADEHSDSDENRSLSKPDEIERFINTTLLPMGNKLGFGGVAGFCTGVAARRIGEWIVYLSGVAFVGLQLAQYNGYIDLDWFAIRKESKSTVLFTAVT